MAREKPSYTPPKVVTLDGTTIVGSLGPVSAGSGTPCIPVNWMGEC